MAEGDSTLSSRSHLPPGWVIPDDEEDITPTKRNVKSEDVEAENIIWNDNKRKRHPILRFADGELHEQSWSHDPPPISTRPSKKRENHTPISRKRKYTAEERAAHVIIPSAKRIPTLPDDRLRLRKENRLLKQKICCLTMSKTRELQELESDVKRLRTWNSGLNKILYDQRQREENHLSPKEETTVLHAELGRKEALIDDQRADLIRTKKTLDRLRSALPGIENEVSADDFAYALRSDMGQIQNLNLYIADVLRQRLKPKKRRQHFGRCLDIIRDTIGNQNLLYSNTGAALRAIVFGFIHQQVIHAPGTWHNLHFDGMMMREYQRTLEEVGSPAILEQYHRSTLFHMMNEKVFTEYFIPAHTEELKVEVNDLLRPIINVDDKDKELENLWSQLFSRTLSFRARCYPPDGMRLQLLQYTPGTIYDEATMEAQEETCAPVQVAENEGHHRVKLCVQGLLVSYTVNEVPSGMDHIKELSQPFMADPPCRDDPARGRSVIKKAVVILE